MTLHHSPYVYILYSQDKAHLSKKSLNILNLVNISLSLTPSIEI